MRLIRPGPAGANDMRRKILVAGVLLLAGAWTGACIAGPKGAMAHGHDLQAMAGPSFNSASPTDVGGVRA